jgi:hypothetical protein
MFNLDAFILKKPTMKKILQLVLITTILSLSNYLFAQKQIEGTVADVETGEPLVWANVYVTNSPEKGTTTNEKGEFTLQIDENVQTLSASYIGYRDQTIELDEGKTNLEFNLHSNLQETETVVVTGTKTKHRMLDVPGRMSIVGIQQISALPGASADDLLKFYVA